MAMKPLLDYQKLKNLSIEDHQMKPENFQYYKDYSDYSTSKQHILDEDDPPSCVLLSDNVKDPGSY